MSDLQAYTVIANLDLPHCEEGKHEHFGPCPDCDEKGMQVVDEKAGTYKKCATCKGTREGGPSLGLRDCDLPVTRYVPGQTVHLSPEGAAPHLAKGLLAPSGAEDVDRRIVEAAAKQYGLIPS